MQEVGIFDAFPGVHVGGVTVRDAEIPVVGFGADLDLSDLIIPDPDGVADVLRQLHRQVFHAANTRWVKLVVWMRGG